MNLWMVLSLLAALAAIFGLGSWTIFRIAPDFATAPQDASLSLWIATVVAALGAVIVIAFSWLRMRAGLRQRMLELAETLRQVASGDRLARAPIVGRDELAILSASVNAMLDGAPLPTFGRGAAPQSPEAMLLQHQIEKLLH